MSKQCVLVDDIDIYRNCTVLTINGIQIMVKMPLNHENVMFLDKHDNEVRKEEREKVWELARKLFLSADYVGMPYKEIEDCFGTKSITAVLKTPVDEALEKYESWKKKNSAEELIKSLKPQDVVYVKGRFGETFVGMVTRVRLNAAERQLDILHTDGSVDTIFFPEDIEHIEKIGRIVEANDILGDIAKIEKYWRKTNRCGS